MRLLAMLALVGALGLGAVGCKTIYEPILVPGEVRAGVVVPPTPGPYDLQETPQPADGEPGKFVVLRARTVVDWGRVGDVTCHVLEGTGVVLLYTAQITAEALVHCAVACCGR